MNVKRLIVLNNHISEGLIVVPPFKECPIILIDVINTADGLGVYISRATSDRMLGGTYQYIRKYMIRIIKIYGIDVPHLYIHSRINKI